MNRWLSLAASLAFLPAAAHGGVISRDWKTPGDGLLTYDDVNKREWLICQRVDCQLFRGTPQLNDIKASYLPLLRVVGLRDLSPQVVMTFAN